MKKKQIAENDIFSSDEIIIEISPQWSKFDQKNWKTLEIFIDNRIEEGVKWSDMQECSLEVISQVSFYYNPKNSEKELGFSASELLLALEEVSRRYRGYLQDYIPFENKIKLSIFKHGYNHRDKTKIFKYLFDAYRVTRIANPMVALLSEMKGMITSHLFDGVTVTIQNKIKRALLKDVASVSIDLYRGYFKVKDFELNESKISIEDKKSKTMKLEPLRVVVVGQVGAGKSSVINALIDKMEAEVSSIPSTDKIALYQCNIDDIEAIKLIDLPGLDGNLESEKYIVEQMIHSDIIFWVLKANQSARKLDALLKSKFDEFYQKVENRDRKEPYILALVNQVDKLHPQNEWNPPYDLNECNASDKKACTIRDAVKYNQKLLDPDDILALSVHPNIEMYNVDAMKKYLQDGYDNGINTQLNRRRHEHNGEGWVEHSKKVYRAGIKLYKL